MGQSTDLYDQKISIQPPRKKRKQCFCLLFTSSSGSWKLFASLNHRWHLRELEGLDQECGLSFRPLRQKYLRKENSPRQRLSSSTNSVISFLTTKILFDLLVKRPFHFFLFPRSPFLPRARESLKQRGRRIVKKRREGHLTFSRRTTCRDRAIHRAVNPKHLSQRVCTWYTRPISFHYLD